MYYVSSQKISCLHILSHDNCISYPPIKTTPKIGTTTTPPAAIYHRYIATRTCHQLFSTLPSFICNKIKVSQQLFAVRCVDSVSEQWFYRSHGKQAQGWETEHEGIFLSLRWAALTGVFQEIKSACIYSSWKLFISSCLSLVKGCDICIELHISRSWL